MSEGINSGIPKKILKELGADLVEGEGLRLGWYWFKYKLKVFFKKYTLQPDESVKVSTFPQKLTLYT